MINKLILGRYLEFPVFPFPLWQPMADLPEHFVLVQNQSYFLKESKVRKGHRISNIREGDHEDKAHRNFRWLPWIPGEITCLPYQGSDILSGPFSGCWVVEFSFQGVRYLGHIGTSEPGANETMRVKEAWREVTAAGHINVHFTFNPLRLAPFTWDAAAGARARPLEIYAACSLEGGSRVVGLTPIGERRSKIIGLAVPEEGDLMFPDPGA